MNFDTLRTRIHKTKNIEELNNLVDELGGKLTKNNSSYSMKEYSHLKGGNYSHKSTAKSFTITVKGVPSISYQPDWI